MIEDAVQGEVTGRQRPARRHGAAARGRDADLHARGRGGRPRHGRDPRDPRRRPPGQRLPAGADLARHGLGRAGLGAHPADLRPGRQEALQAPRRVGDRRLPARWAILASAMRNYLARLGWSHGDDGGLHRRRGEDWFDLVGDQPGAGPASTARSSRTSPGRHMAMTPDDALAARGSRAGSPRPGAPPLDAGSARRSSSRRCRTSRSGRRSYPATPRAGALRPGAHGPSCPMLRLRRRSTPRRAELLAELTPQLQTASWTRDELEGVVSRLADAHGINARQAGRAAARGPGRADRHAQRFRHDARARSRRDLARLKDAA